MNEAVFQVCLTYWKNSTGNQKFWEMLATMFGYTSAEALRSSFKRERKRRGIDKIQNKVVHNNPNLPVVGIVDIETLPALSYHFDPNVRYISADKQFKDISFLSWAGKYINTGTIFSDILTPDEAVHRDSRRITLSAHEFVESCDILIGHNILDFDYKHLKTFFLIDGLRPVKHRLVDTLVVARNNFNFTYNTLAFINKKLGIRMKVSNEGFALWKRCELGEPQALEKMLEYNQGDILANEELFWKVQPYVSTIPNFSLYNKDFDGYTCHCGSTEFEDAGYWYTDTSMYEKLRCDNCGHLVRGRKSILSKDKKENHLLSIRDK